MDCVCSIVIQKVSQGSLQIISLGHCMCVVRGGGGGGGGGVTDYYYSMTHPPSPVNNTVLSLFGPDNVQNSN